jgi:hypothetical protein
MDSRARFQSSRVRRPSSRHSASPERTLEGCLTCRARRVSLWHLSKLTLTFQMRCDGQQPTCRSCIQGDFDCLWPDVGPSNHAQASPKAPRGDRSRLACLPCRSRKVGHPPGWLLMSRLAVLVPLMEIPHVHVPDVIGSLSSVHSPNANDQTHNGMEQRMWMTVVRLGRNPQS